VDKWWISCLTTKNRPTQKGLQKTSFKVIHQRSDVIKDDLEGFKKVIHHLSTTYPPLILTSDVASGMSYRPSKMASYPPLLAEPIIIIINK